MRKAILLAMAATVVAMIAAPGQALASWTKHHVVNTEKVELEVTTTDFYLENQFGVITCNSMISKVLFEGNSTRGRVNSFEPEPQGSITSNCQGTSGLAQCDVHEAKGDNLPWLIYISSKDTVTIKTGTFTTTLTGFACPHTLQLTPGTLTLVVAEGETNTTSRFTMIGALPLDGGLGGGSIQLSGTLHVLGTITYGVGEPGPPPTGWTKDHEFNLFDVEREITGTDVFFESSIGGVTCNQTISKVLFESGTTGRINSFEPEGNITSNCQGRGALAGCDVHEATADGLSWTLHTGSKDTVTITTGSITNTLTGFLCPHTTILTPGTVTMTVGEGETDTVSTATSSGTLTAHIGSSTVTAHVSGTSHVLGTMTYGI